MMDPENLLNPVKEIAKKAGAFIREEAANFSFSNLIRKGKNNFVSYVDKTAEEMIMDALSTVLPEAGFIAEEGTGSRVPDGFNWVIDPLDGTTNFMHGLPPYSVSIALMEKDTVLLGVVYEIVGNECFFATVNGKSFCNEKEISVSDVTKAEEGLYITGFPRENFIRRVNNHIGVGHHQSFLFVVSNFNPLGFFLGDASYLFIIIGIM